MRRKNTPGRLFDRIESKSLSIEVVSQIENLILSGVLNEGDMLPGERELAEQFGISRPKVREALSQLAEDHLVRIVANDGVYVAQLGGAVMSPALVALFNRTIRLLPSLIWSCITQLRLPRTIARSHI